MSSMRHDFFEGVEKLLEVWFDGTGKEAKSLRNIDRAYFDQLTALADCKIISSVSTKYVDAYVLSESSMFVSDRRFVLKTCGSTSLLNTVQPLLEMARRFCSFDKVLNVFYSHKNFLRPELQPEMHRHFEREVATLDRIFPNGAGYCLGRLNQDRWYLYTLNPADGDLPPNDQTMEILMCDLDPYSMTCFCRDVSCCEAEARKTSGLDQLLPKDLIIDEKLFEPCGYSMNGILEDSDSYVTVHVTPEFEHSYVSYESNIRRTVSVEQLTKVVNTFRPGRFIFTAFANKGFEDQRQIQYDLPCTMVTGHQMMDCHLLRLPNHTLVYAYYVKQ